MALHPIGQATQFPGGAAGSVLYVGAGGTVISQDNANLNYSSSTTTLNATKLASGGTRLDAAAKVFLATNYF